MSAINSIGPYTPQFHPDAGAYMAGQRNPDVPTAAEVVCLQQFFRNLRTVAQNVIGDRSVDGTTEVVGLSQCGHVVEFWNSGGLVRIIRRGMYP